MISLFGDGHELELGEGSPVSNSVNLRCSREDTRKVACNIDDLVSLQIQVAVKHGNEMLSGSHQYIE